MNSTDERLLSAAKTDNEELLEAAFADPSVNVNHQDGLGNTGKFHHLRVSSTFNIFAHPLLSSLQHYTTRKSPHTRNHG